MVQTILVVEDDPTIAAMLVRTLRRGLAAEVVQADGNQSALAFLAANVPSLVITDLAHADGCGEDLVEHIRTDRRLRSVPIIVQSGQLFEAGADPRLFEHRIDGALKKPFTMHTLLRVVSRCLTGLDSETSGDAALIRIGAESKTLDYKQTVDLQDKKQRACLAKDVIAFFNSGGGSIVVGVDEEQQGRFVPRGISEAIAQSLEVTRLNDVLRRYIGTELSVTSRRVTYDGMLFMLIAVPSKTTNLAFARDEHQNAALYPGRIYARNDAAQSAEVRDGVTLNEMLDQLVRARLTAK